MFSCAFSLILRPSCACARSVRIASLIGPSAGHSLASDGWAAGATAGVCLRLLIVGRRDGRRMSPVRGESRVSAERSLDTVVLTEETL